MKVLSKKDVLNALITGLTAGLAGWGVLSFLDKSLPFGFSPSLLIIALPLAWLAGVQFGYFLGKWINFFNQFGKYVAIGFTNFAVDAGVFNLLLSITHAPEGPLYVAQKAFSFMKAVIHSYFWNSKWAFRSENLNALGQKSLGSEFTKFIIVNLIAMVVNVGTAYSVIHFITRPDSFTPEVWANVGAVAGSAAALIFSFVGFKMVVFKKNNSPRRN